MSNVASAMSNAIPCIRAQIEALNVCAEAIRLENERRRLAQDLAKKKMLSGSASTAKLRQEDAHRRYLAALAAVGRGTSQQVADHLSVTQSAARSQLRAMHKLGLVRYGGTRALRVWEAS